MTQNRQCTSCQADLPEDAPGNRCPKCLLELGLEDPGSAPENNAPLPNPLPAKEGEWIGRYKLLQQIGEGGCGVVYMAEQEEPVRRRVALKVIKLGMDTKTVIARFEAERQALAIMEHPNIAHVFDGGATDTGRPYFVMELVRGIRITEYCDQHKLSTRERLELFLQVCQAVQHAHQKGIIHRDLKPSNILVTVNNGVAVPKVIDFGVAKATEQRLTDKTLFTRFEAFIGTPAYMSPEQAEMSSLDIDTRSDIYSLGVLLYELLTGQTPFDARTLQESGLEAMRRTIREVEPPRPSTRLRTLAGGQLTTTAEQRRTDSSHLMSALRGDLDWIVMKCLDKDRTRRYETADSLALDLHRHLNNEAVLACPPSQIYRLQKLVRRNKQVFAGAIAVLVALVIGLSVSTRLYFREKAAHQRALAAEGKAQTEAARSTQVAQFLKEMLQGVGPSKAMGRDTTMFREILDKTAERIGKTLTNQPEVEVELRLTLAETYEDLGLYQQSGEMAGRSLRLARAVFGNEHPTTARALAALGTSLHFVGTSSEAEKLLREALSIERKVFPTGHPDLVRTLDSLAYLLRGGIGRPVESERLQREAIAMKRRLFGNNDPTLPRSLNNLGMLLRDGRGSPTRASEAEAEALFRESIAVSEKFFGKDYPERARSLNHLGHLLCRQARLDEAEDALTEALKIQRKVLGNAHPDTARSLENLGGVRLRQQRLREAEALYREALGIKERRVGEQQLFSQSIVPLAWLLRRQGRLAEIVDVYREIAQLGNGYGQVALATAYIAGEGIQKNEAEAAKWFRMAAQSGDLANRLWNIGRSYFSDMDGVKDEAEAAKWFQRAAEEFRKRAQSGDAGALNDFAWFLVSCRMEQFRDGRSAVELAGKAVASTSRTNANYIDTLAAAHAECGEFNKAVSVEREALALLEDEKLRIEFESRLKSYEAKSPYRPREEGSQEEQPTQTRPTAAEQLRIGP